MTASGRGAQPGADAGGHQHLGTAEGHRRAGVPRGTAGGLGSIAIAPHWPRRGPKVATSITVTKSGQRAGE